MNYEPAKLTQDAVEQVRQLENRLSGQAGQPIVLIAYAQEQEERPNGGRDADG